MKFQAAKSGIKNLFSISKQSQDCKLTSSSGPANRVRTLDIFDGAAIMSLFYCYLVLETSTHFLFTEAAEQEVC